MHPGRPYGWESPSKIVLVFSWTVISATSCRFIKISFRTYHFLVFLVTNGSSLLLLNGELWRWLPCSLQLSSMLKLNALYKRLEVADVKDGLLERNSDWLATCLTGLVNISLSRFILLWRSSSYPWDSSRLCLPLSGTHSNRWSGYSSLWEFTAPFLSQYDGVLENDLFIVRRLRLYITDFFL